MNDVKRQFKSMYNITLVERLSKDLSGDYKKIVIKLANL